MSTVIKSVIKASDPRVVSFYNHYHERKAVFPTMYTDAHSNQTINVVLPINLVEFSNAAAGRFAVGNDGIIRPKGIRVQVADAQTVVEHIFASPENLADFLNASECNGLEYEGSERVSELTNYTPVQRDPLDRPIADQNLEVRYGKGTIQRLAEKYGRELVQREYRILTVFEFEQRYGLVAIVA